jgi:hypothetical protein
LRTPHFLSPQILTSHHHHLSPLPWHTCIAHTLTQGSVKVANEAPADIKSNIQRGRDIVSHSEPSHSFYDSIESLHYCLLIASPLPRHCLTIASPLPHHCLTIASPLPHHCLAIASPLPRHCLTIASPLPHHCLTLSHSQHRLEQLLPRAHRGMPEEERLQSVSVLSVLVPLGCARSEKIRPTG